MTRLSLKSLLIIVVLLLIGIVGLWRIQQSVKKVSASWFNDAWQYRKAITLTNSGTGQTNVYVTLTIGTSDTARFQADAGDIRFTKQNGELLDYFIVSGAGTSSTVIHVNFDIYTAGASTFYLYYGNSSATNGFSSADFSTAASNSSTNLLSEERSPAPIAYWSFDEGVGTSVFDSSPNRITGTFYGSPTWKDESDCVSGKCLNFSGDKMGINIGNTTSQLNITGPISLSVWVKPTSISNLISIINRAGFTGPDNGFSLEIHNGKPIVVLNNGRIANSTQKCNQAISANVFSNIYWTRDVANNNKIFIDGKECTYSSSISVTQVDTNTSLGIGTKLNKENLAPYSDYSNRNYNTLYDIGGWGGDDAEVYYYSSGGYNNLPYKKMIKTAGGTGGSFINDYAYFPIQDSRTYIVSSYLKASRNETTGAYTLDINRDADNAYRTNGNINLTPNWQRYSWVYSAGVGHSGQYHARNIIYVDTDLPFETYWSGFKVEDVTGTGQTTPSYDFSGNMDEVKIYAYARTATQIKQDYAVGKAKVGGKGAGVAVGKDNTDVGSSPPIAYYNFEEGVGTSIFDRSGNGNNGVLGSGTSAPTWTIGKYGKALSFNGAQKVTTPTLNIGSSFTVGFWVKPTTLYDYGDPVSAGAADKWLTFVTYANGGMGHTIGDGNAWGNTISQSAGTLVNNQWYYFTGTYNGTNTQFFINGIAVGGTAVNTGYTINQPFSIGSRAGYFYYFKGLVDELKIYNYVRTQKQILQDMNAGNPMSQKTPILWYKFDEGQGTVVNNWGSIGSTLNSTFTAGKLPTWTNNGKVGKALSFSTSQIEFTDYTNSPLDTENGVTYSLWAYPTTSNVSKYLMYKLSAYDLSYGDSVCGNGKFGISIYGVTTRVWLCALNTSSLNNWYHIAGSATPNGEIKIYINGILNNSADFAYATIGISNSKLTYGDYSGGGYAFSGIIDEPKIYNYALSDDEIKTDYNQGAQFVMGKSNQTIGGTTTSLDYCIPGDTTACSPPIAEWKFEEGTGTSIVDTSGNNYTSTFVGTPSRTIGKIGQAISFNGSTNGVSLSGPTTYTDETLSAWVYIDSSSPSGDIVGNCHTNYNQQYGFTLYLDGNTLRAKAATNGDTTFYDNVSYDITSLKNRWLYLSMVWDNLGTGTGGCDATVELFVNGQLVDQATSNVSAGGYACTRPYPYPFSMGGTTINSLTRPTKIKLDNVRVYNYARTPAQIAYDYNGGKPVGWWKFDECEGTMINDWSGIGNTGALTIGPSGTQATVGTCSIGDTSAWSNGNTGKINSSMSFDGTDDKVTIGDPSNGTLDFGTNDFSTSAWFKTSTSEIGVIVGKYNGYPLWYSKILASGKIEVRIGFDANTNYSISTGATVNDNQWHNIITVYKRNGNLTKYIDGKIDSTPVDISSSSSTSVNTNNEFIVGGGVSTQFFGGLIDDVRIYNYALTSEQVKQVYNGGAINFR